MKQLALWYLNAVSGIVKYDRELDYLDTLAEKRNLINLNQVKNASTKYIDPQKWTWIIVGDLSMVEEGIRNLELGEVKIIKANKNMSKICTSYRSFIWNRFGSFKKSCFKGI